MIGAQKSPACLEGQPGLKNQELLGGHRCWSWRRSGRWAARCGKEGSCSGDDDQFSDFHGCVGGWLHLGPRNLRDLMASD
jgi:hypothetical protein